MLSIAHALIALPAGCSSGLPVPPVVRVVVPVVGFSINLEEPAG